MIKKNDKTTELINRFDKLCEKYAFEDIDAKKLRKGVSEVIDNYT